jgi:hypothetical protein
MWKFLVEMQFLVYLRLLVTLGLIAVFLSCSPIKDESEIVGSYRLKERDTDIKLTVRMDHTFTEEVSSPERKYQSTGGWRWNSGAIDFDHLLIPYDVIPSSIKRAEALSSPNIPGYSSIEHWIITPEKTFGRIVLEIFPDSDVEFSKLAE